MRMLVVGYGVQGKKRYRIAGDEAVGIVDPIAPEAKWHDIREAPLDAFDPGCAAFEPAAIEALADLGAMLVGIDTASVDPTDSKTLDSHQVLRRRRLRVLENLVLDEVPEGDYELIALPLKLTTADASPVRAVLRPLPA